MGKVSPRTFEAFSMRMKSNIFALSKRGSGIFFVCYQLSCFLPATGVYKVGESWELCHAIAL
jgi:hypothetical protein